MCVEKLKCNRDKELTTTVSGFFRGGGIVLLHIFGPAGTNLGIELDLLMLTAPFNLISLLLGDPQGLDTGGLTGSRHPLWKLCYCGFRLLS